MEMEAQQPQAGPKSGEVQILERFIYNAMLLASKDSHDQMLAVAKSADNGAQALARAMLFIIKAVRKGLQDKGVEVPGKLYLAENGIFSQVSRAITALLVKAGVQIAPEEVAQAIEMVSAQIASDYDREQNGQAEQPEAPAPAGPPAGPEQPQAAPAQAGLLAQAQGGA